MKPQLIALSAALLLGFATAGKLSPKYLPPNYAGSSSAAGHLQGPQQRPSNQYLAPTQHYHAVSGGGGGVGHGHGHGHGHFAAAASSPGAHYGHNRAEAQIPILRNNYANDGNGNYNFDFETGNGIRRDEMATFKGGWPHGSQSVTGSYSYTGDDGQVYTVNYKADDTGFHAEGAHLPTPPPIPKEIQQSLALRQSHSSSGQRYGGAPAAYSGGYTAAGSAHAPSSQYLPPGPQGYNYGRRH